MSAFDLTYLSLGGGRQSTALAICSALGLHGVPKAHVCIFADTGDEVRDTYEHFERFGPWLKERGIPLEIVKQGNLGEELVGMKEKSKRGFIVSIPAFTATTEGAAPLRRQCTQEYKLLPIQRKVRDILGFAKGERIAGKKMARALIGISLDEIYRVKPSRDAWVENCYPLVDARLNVQDCMKICKDHLGYVPIKSACRFCPYHDNHYWSWLKRERPEEFEMACKTDEGIRDLSRAGVKMPAYLHRSLQPLRVVDFDAKGRGQLMISGFGNECEGVCGV